MPHQSQGACMAIEDAAALGIIFSKSYFDGDVTAALKVYEEVRLPRVTRVQSAAAKAAYNINERIGMCAPTYHNSINSLTPWTVRVFHQYQHLHIQSGRREEEVDDRRDECVCSGQSLVRELKKG